LPPDCATFVLIMMSSTGDNESAPAFRRAEIMSNRSNLISSQDDITADTTALGLKKGPSTETKMTNLSKNKFTRKLTLGRLPEVPEFYILQKQHQSFATSRLNNVVDSIIDCLGKLSILATYNIDEATIRAETCDHGKFNVRFYRSKETAGSFVVEIHRLNSIFGFSALTRTIFDSVKINGPLQNSRSFPKKKLTLPDDAFPELEDEFHSKDDGVSALEEAFKLMGEDRQSDMQELGVETMICLTDRELTVSCVAKTVANAVVHGSGSLNDVQLKIYNLIMIGNFQDDECYRCEETCGEQAKRMRRGALKVFSNSLETISSFDDSDVLSLSGSVWFQEALSCVLLRDLNAAETNPHEAYLASRCLNTMMNMSESFRTQLKGVSGVLNILKDVENACRNPHQLLAKESHNLMKTMSA